MTSSDMNSSTRGGMTIGVLIPTLNAGTQLRETLLKIRKCKTASSVLVIDSDSSDGTPELARKYGAHVLTIDRAAFNHGSTRELARKFLGTDVVVMLTQDAEPACDDLLERLVAPITSGQAVVSYGRQLARPDAGFAESFAREFNYPVESEIRTIADVDRRGAFTFFCSNSCAAWDNAALDRIGGFPRVLMAEDTLTAALLLQAGGAIAYVAEATVRHSHSISPAQEFRRQFDAGYVRATYSNVFRISSDHARGRQYSKLLFARVFSQDPLHLPPVIVRTAAKYAGYLLGRLGPSLPPSVCLRLSNNPYFWRPSVTAGQTSEPFMNEPRGGNKT